MPLRHSYYALDLLTTLTARGTGSLGFYVQVRAAVITGRRFGGGISNPHVVADHT